MKTKLTLLILLLGLAANAAVTNITFTVKVENDVSNGTNTVTLKYTHPGTAKDQQAVNAMVWYFRSYQSTNGGFGTNATLEAALKNDIRDRIVFPRIAEKVTADNAVRKSDFTAKVGEMTASQLSQIDAILAAVTLP